MGYRNRPKHTLIYTDVDYLESHLFILDGGFPLKLKLLAEGEVPCTQSLD